MRAGVEEAARMSRRWARWCPRARPWRCRRARFWWRPALSPIRCSAVKIRSNVVLDGKYFQAVDEEGNPVKPERVAKPERGPGVDVGAAGRAGDQLLRRPASFLRRQRGESHGRGQAGLSGGVALPGAARACGTRAADSWLARLNYELRAVVKEVVRLTPDIVRCDRAGPHGRACVQAGPVLPAAEL